MITFFPHIPSCIFPNASIAPRTHITTDCRGDESAKAELLCSTKFKSFFRIKAYRWGCRSAARLERLRRFERPRRRPQVSSSSLLIEARVERTTQSAISPIPILSWASFFPFRHSPPLFSIPSLLSLFPFPLSLLPELLIRFPVDEESKGGFPVCRLLCST